MELVREVCSAGHAIRKDNRKPVRHPLRTLLVAGPGALALEDYKELMRNELNVKEVVLTADVEGVAVEVLAVVPGAIGPRLGEKTQQVIRAVKSGEWTRTDDGSIEAAGVVLEQGEFTLVLQPKDPDAGRSLPDRAGVVRVDLETDDELEREGLARDVVRLVQEKRRSEGLHVSDRILLELSLPAPMAVAVDEHRVWLMEQTLATDLKVQVGDPVEIKITLAAPGG